MATRNGIHGLPPRPPLSSHQSSSVPSTPHQHAREFRSHSRSPSPNTGLGLGLVSHSPRSVVSESNGPMTALPKGRPTCKYETSAAFSRRRMQYDIGDAPLERPKEEPKKILDPHEEKKLSGDMRELYDRLLPSEESDNRRHLFVEKLENILHKQWPDTEFRVHIFGSSGNMLCTSESDVDICIQTPMKKLETMHTLADVLAHNGMDRVVCIGAAKVPIVKIWDPELKLAVDMNVNNTLAIENTRMIKTYVQIDHRVRPLAMIIKHWTKQRILNDAGIGGTLSSYAWICLILNFLQTRKPPILPALHQLPHKEYKAQDGTESGFNDDIEKLRDFGAENTETIGELLFRFFRHYGFDMDYENSAISVRHGKVLSRKEKGWDLTSKEGQWRLAIEEPFNTTRNLGNSADSTAFRGIHLEIRQAYEHLAKGVNLDKLLEAYQYPAEEKSIFKKPVAGPKPILSAAISPIPPSSRASRGGGSMRAPRQINIRQGSAYRRSSSGAAFGRQQYSFLSSPPLGAGGLDYIQTGSPEALARIRAELLQQSQQTGMQLEQLQARYAFQEMQIRAEQHARSAAAAHAQAVVHGSNQSNQASQATSATVTPQKTPYLTGASSPQLSHNSVMYPEYMYQAFPSGYDASHLSQSASSHDGARTNPSSPSLANAVPRRSVQRSNMGTSNAGASGLRSQSQPPRSGVPNTFVPQYPPFVGMAPYGFYPGTAPSRESTNISHPSTEIPVPAGLEGLYRTASMPVQDATPKEYVGYIDPRVSQSSPLAQAPSFPVFGSLPQIPQFSELAHRRNRPSQDLSLTLHEGRRASRSPSPLGHGHQRTYSIPVHGGSTSRSAPLPNHPTYQVDKANAAADGLESRGSSAGPVVVNGSFPISRTPDTRSTTSDEDAFTTGKDDMVNPPFSQPNAFGHVDALGLSGFQHAYGPEQQYHSMGFASPTNSTLPEYLNDASEGLSSVYSPPMQPFPAFDPAATATLIPKGFGLEDQVVSPKANHGQWAASLPPKPKVPPLDTVIAIQAQALNKQGEAKTAPLLSPVYETRTPSPTARRSEHFRQTSINGILSHAHANGDFAKLNGSPTAVPPTPGGRLEKSSSTSIPKAANTNGGPTNGQWQQTTTRKKNRKRTKSGPSRTPASAETKAKPQQMPANENERKGG